MCPLKLCIITVVRLVTAYKILLFFAVGGQRELWHSHLSLLRPTSVRSQMSLGSREAASTRHSGTEKPPGNLRRRKLSDQIKFSCSAGESGNSKTRMLSPQGCKYASPGVKWACGFKCLSRATAGLTWDYLGGTAGLHTLCLEEASEQGRTMACPCSPPCHLWPNWWPQGWEGRGGGCQPLPVSHPLTPLAGKAVILLSCSPLLIPHLRFLHEPSHTKPAFPQVTPLCSQWEFEWKWSNNPDLGYGCGKTTSSSWEFGYNHIFILASYLKHKRKHLSSAQLWYLCLCSSQRLPDKDWVFSIN